MKTRLILILSISIAMIFALACGNEAAKKAPADESKGTPENTETAEKTDKADEGSKEGDKEDPTVGGSPMSAEKDIVDNASNSKDHTTLVAALKAAGLVETLKGEGPFTVFAPTNTAFEKLPEGTVETLLKPENKEKLKGILTYHVVAGNLNAKAVAEAIEKGGGKASLKTVAGGEIIASLDGDAVIITDEKGGKSKVTIADLMQKNGVIHVVDTVLMPK